MDIYTMLAAHYALFVSLSKKNNTMSVHNHDEEIIRRNFNRVKPLDIDKKIESQMSFSFFVSTMNDVLVFWPGKEWDSDEWNQSYIDFKDCIKSWAKPYLASKTDEEKIREWAKDYYQPASLQTHNYELKI